MDQWSSLAVPAVRLRQERQRKGRPRGACLHTTGSGVRAKADQAGGWRGFTDPLDVAVALYCDAGANFPHYVIGDRVVQIAAEDVRAWHAGVTAADRQLYLSGMWHRRLSASAMKLWQEAWPGKASPIDITRDPNEDYVGIELIPQADGTFSDDQYALLTDLLLDIWARNDWGQAVTGDASYWQLARAHGLLVGHEDVNPLERFDSHGGWDPGAIRSEPRFLWSKLFSLLAAREG